MGGFCSPPGLTDFKKPGLNRVNIPRGSCGEVSLRSLSN